MIALVRSLLVTWVVLWSTSRQDVTLHLVAWIILGSAVAGFTRSAWMARFPFLIDFAEDASGEFLDILPDSDMLVTLLSFAICGMAAFFLAGAEHKSRGGSMRGAWLFFAAARLLFPVSACGVEYKRDPAEAALVGLFIVLSLVGPLSSWPSRVFALSDFVYAMVVQQNGNDGLCSGTEAAVVAAGLALAHDVVHLRFLHFLESVAFSIAAVFIVETTIMVALFKETATEETWGEALNPLSSSDLNAYLFTKAPPVLLFSWAIGMLLRTLTQGRVSIMELLCSLGAGAAVGGAILATSKIPEKMIEKPSFACVVAVTAMAAASWLAVGRKRVLKMNNYVLATGVFPREIIIASLSEQSQGGQGHSAAVEWDGTDPDSNGAEVPPMKLEELMRSFSGGSVPMDSLPASAFTTMTPTSRSNITASGAVVEPQQTVLDRIHDELDRALQKMKTIQQTLFRKEALMKGHQNQADKDSAKEEIGRLKAESETLRTKVEELRKQAVDLEGPV